jgi:hypothetical protein
MKSIKFSIIIFIVSGLSACSGMLPFHNVTCKPFALRGETYWFPTQVGETVIFVNDKNREEVYTVMDKYISHTTNYITDTGCACRDRTGMLLINGNDSIWFNNQLIYQENQEEKYYEDIFFIIAGKQSGFYETSKKHLESYSIGTVDFLDVELFECSECEANWSVKKLYRVKNLGIVQLEFVNGEIWVNKNLSDYKAIDKESFEYKEYVCD